MAFAALGAFVYFYEIKGGEERDQAKALEEKLLKVEEDDLQVIEVRLPNDAPIRLERRSGDWRLEAPVRGGVDRFAVEALTREHRVDILVTERAGTPVAVITETAIMAPPEVMYGTDWSEKAGRRGSFPYVVTELAGWARPDAAR